MEFLLEESLQEEKIFQKVKLDFIDLCSGIGSGRLALEKCGLNCIGYSEINTHSIRTYKTFFDTSQEMAFGDMLKINTKELPNIDLLLAGFPCQTFSIVGKRYGFEDERGQIIFKINQILQTKNPKYFILENVKGLMNLNSGYEYNQIKLMLKKSGYVVYSKVLNSYNFGIPQMRERIYFVGIREDLKYKDFYFPLSQDYNYDLSQYLIEDKTEFVLSGQTYNTFLKYLSNKYNKEMYNLSSLLREDYLILDTRQSDLRIYKNRVPTLRTGRHGILYVKDKQLRKLSGKEALLLQGFSLDEINKLDISFTETQLLSQAGNAMTVNVIYEIMKKLSFVVVRNDE